MEAQAICYLYLAIGVRYHTGAMNRSRDTLPRLLCENSFSKLGRPTNLWPFGISRIHCFSVTQVLESPRKPVDSQQTLGFNILPIEGLPIPA
jgi:hypothetical protein